MNNISSKIKKMSKVNLDALIPRADFIDDKTTPGDFSTIEKLTLGHLLPNSSGNYISIYHLLKKPDFQRETNEWDKKRICDLIEAFIDRSFIPSVILWQNAQTGNLYVIDGSHRLSAIIAFINDDYGDMEISHTFYSYNKIPQAELELAQETRDYIKKRLGGSFKEIMEQGGQKADGIKKASFDVQFVKGDVVVAEKSFFKINQQGVVLSPTEKKLCESRPKPICISTRIIMKGAGGEQYWKNFTADNQAKSRSVAQELHKALFEPPYNQDTKSIILHHPLGGSITNAMPMIFNLMEIIKSHYSNNNEWEPVDDRYSGSATCEILEITRKLIWKILSEQPGSLGLFPSIYFYNSGGKYIQSAFLGMAELLIENSNNDSVFLPKFIQVRKSLEDFLIKYKVFITQINRKYGSKERSHRHMKGFFLNLLNLLSLEQDEAKIIASLKVKYDFLNEIESDTEKSKPGKFSKEAKIAGIIKEELHGIVKCHICGGHVHPMSKSHDHNDDVKNGGKSFEYNRKSSHVYCNMSKDKLIKMGIHIPEKIENNP